MKNRIFDFTTEPQEESTLTAMANAWAIIMDMLSEEDEKQLSDEFKAYRDDCTAKGEKYIPAYLWTLQRIKVTLGG